MEIVKKENIKLEALPGRGIQRAVGKNSCFGSDTMTVGYALYDDTYGQMEPHHHAEETCIVIKSINGSVSWGDSKDTLSNSSPLYDGMVLHIPENEWHVFNYEKGGCVEIIFIYGTTENLRPEDKK